MPNAKASESAIPVSRQPTRAKTSYNSKLSRVTSHDLSLTVRFDTAILSSIIGLLSRPCPRIGLPNWTCGSFPGFAARMERRVFLLRSQFRPCSKLSLRLPPPAVATLLKLGSVRAVGNSEVSPKRRFAGIGPALSPSVYQRIGSSQRKFSPSSVQFKGEISGGFPRKRHQKRHLDFCTPCLLSRMLPAPGDTIDGGGPVHIHKHGSRTFVSDGVSNWITISEVK